MFPYCSSSIAAIRPAYSHIENIAIKKSGQASNKHRFEQNSASQGGWEIALALSVKMSWSESFVRDQKNLARLRLLLRSLASRDFPPLFFSLQALHTTTWVQHHSLIFPSVTQEINFLNIGESLRINSGTIPISRHRGVEGLTFKSSRSRRKHTSTPPLLPLIQYVGDC